MHLRYFQDSSVLSIRARRNALSAHYHALILNGESINKLMHYSIELKRGTVVWKTFNSVMQIRQRQARFKHASETDNKLFFPESAVYFSVFSFWLWETKILHSHGWQLATSPVLFSDIEGLNFVLFCFVLLFYLEVLTTKTTFLLSIARVLSPSSL